MARTSRRTAPFPISLPAMGLLVQIFVLHFTALWYTINWPSWRAAGWFSPVNKDLVIMPLPYSLLLVNSLWAGLLAIQVAVEFRRHSPIRRSRLICDIFALLLALYITYGSCLMVDTYQAIKGPPPQATFDFEFDPETGKWWLQ